MFEALGNVVGTVALEEFITEMHTTPWKKVTALLQEEMTAESQVALREEIKKAPHSKVFGRTYHVYALREIALLFAHHERITSEELEQYFRDSHFEDELPKERMDMLTQKLIEMIERV